MGEVIHIREIVRRRDIAKSQARDRESLERAVEILKQNLHATTSEIVAAAASEQPELLDRAERLVALIRYGMRMLGDSIEAEPLLFISK